MDLHARHVANAQYGRLRHARRAVGSRPKRCHVARAMLRLFSRDMATIAAALARREAIGAYFRYENKKKIREWLEKLFSSLC